ncbi:MAG: hypothetical protein WDW38_000092 [Sanguina aurantia]
MKGKDEANKQRDEDKRKMGGKPTTPSSAPQVADSGEEATPTPRKPADGRNKRAATAARAVIHDSDDDGPADHKQDGPGGEDPGGEDEQEVSVTSNLCCGTRQADCRQCE